MNKRQKLVAATLQIKEIHASGGRQLTKQQQIGFAKRQSKRYLGMPTAWRVQTSVEILAADEAGPAKHQARKQRGRKPQTAFTQYDASYLRWRGIHHRLIRLPALRKETGYLDCPLIEQLLLTYHQRGIPRHKLVATVLDYFEQHPELPRPSASTLRRIRGAVIPSSPK